MELSERCIQILENEGFSTVYEESLAPGEVFEVAPSLHLITIFVTEGTLLTAGNHETKSLVPGERFDLPPQKAYAFTAGRVGAQCVVGDFS